MKTIKFNQGQVGDLCINTVAARLFKLQHPDETLIMSVNKKYADLIPLFYNHPHIDGFKIWDGYDDFSKKDIDWIIANQDKYTIYPTMPQHTSNDWWMFNHQAKECCLMNGLLDTKLLNNDYSCYLEKWFDLSPFLFKRRNIAFAPFAGWYNKNNDKKLTIEKAQSLATDISKLGFAVLQIGGKDEPKLNDTWKVETSYVDSLKNILASELLVTTDTWAAWYSSAYKHKTIGLYSNNYYTKNGINHISSIQPINENAIYLDSYNVNDIPNELILDKIMKLV
jgi:hypothetical protein